MYKRDTYFQHLKWTTVNSLSHLLLVLLLHNGQMARGPDEATQEQKLNASDKLIWKKKTKKTPVLSGKQGNKKLSTNKWSITLHPLPQISTQSVERWHLLPMGRGGSCAPVWLVDSEPRSFGETSWGLSQPCCSWSVGHKNKSTWTEDIYTGAYYEALPFSASLNWVLPSCSTDQVAGGQLCHIYTMNHSSHSN